MISDLGGDIAVGVAVNDDDSDADEDVETRDAWGEMEDMPDDREEGISEAVRLARMRTRLAACEALAVTMTDPAVHARVTVGVVILRKLKDVNLTMPYALPDPTTLATLEVVYETLNSIIDDDRRPLVLAAARGPLTAALGEQPSALTLTAVVVRDPDGGAITVTLQNLTPTYTRIGPVAAVKAKAASGSGAAATKAVAAVRAATAVQHEEALFESTCATALAAVTAASVTYDKRTCAPS